MSVNDDFSREKNLSDSSAVDGSQPLSRRALVRSAGVFASLALGAPIRRALTQTSTAGATRATPTAPPDASKVPGLPSGALSTRSPLEAPALTPTGVTTGASFTPLQDLSGTITPSDLHFQRHHNGIATIDPARYRLTIHGLVERPVSFSVEELKRFPSVTRVHYIECSGNGRTAYRTPQPDMTPQIVDGLTSNSEWTGVLVSTLLREARVRSTATWMLAEGGDVAVLSRSVSMVKMLEDALVAYAQNGEPVRAANGYPARLILPGYEGNMNIKWPRRLKAIDQPNMSRDETAKYTDPLPDGTSRQFSFIVDAKSIITSPAHPTRLSGAGWWPVHGIAWTGRGKIHLVDVSTNGGRTWSAADLVGPVYRNAHTRFQYVHRAMPFNAPGSLTPSETYSLVAYLLSENGVISSGTVVDANTLPNVRMPARSHLPKRRGTFPFSKESHAGQ